MKNVAEMRIIVDTNLWISFLIGRKLAYLLDLFSHPDFQLVISPELIDEIRSVFQRPKFTRYYTPEKLAMLLDFMKEETLMFYLSEIPPRCRDAKDDYLLELAVVSEADYLITGDNDLLTLNKIGTCQIVTAMEFDAIAASMGHPTTLNEAMEEGAGFVTIP